jgi:hypothetical protein
VVAAEDPVEVARHDLNTLYAEAERYLKLRQRQANWWYTARSIGAPLAAGTAAIAGFAGLAQLVGSTTAAILALVSAGLGAAITALNPVQRANDLTLSAHRWCELAHHIDLARKFELTSVREETQSIKLLVKKHDDAFCRLQRGEYGFRRDKHPHEGCPGGPGHSWRPQLVWASRSSDTQPTGGTRAATP